MWWLKSLWFDLFCHHSLGCNTVCGMGIWISSKVWILFFFNVFYGWFQVSYIFSFVKCNVFAGIVWYQNLGRCFAFNVVNAIYNVYIGILTFCWILIPDEACSMSCYCVTFDLNGYDAIMSRRYFECWFNNFYCCLLFTVPGVCEKSAILFYVAILFLIPSI